jgi:glycine betaine/proline transport system substrate-binding protein
MRSKRLLATAVVAVFALVGAACGSDDDKGSGSGDGGGETITLARNAWTASAIDVEIAKQLIEKELGNDVKLVDIDENAMFAGMESGDIDAALEIWPSGVVEEEQAFIDDGSVLDIGKLGAVGQIGWYVPDYVLKDHPDVATWEGLKDPETAKLFATAETGDKGRFLATDPSYSQYDESIVEQLDLPFEVKYSGSEAATVAELDSKVADKEPVVMYWWTPTAAVAKYNLKEVKLPEYTEECYADPETVDCAYPEDVLFKAASAKLKTKDPKVFSFLEKFQLTNEDQLGMLPAVEIDKEPAEDVAAQWIKDNEATWKAWFN